MTETSVVNSYITTIEDAAAYFAGDPRATALLALGTGMSWYLQRATKAIDALPLRGRKYTLDGTQSLQFPREYRDGFDMNELTGVAKVPQNVLDACCEEALALYLFQADPMAQEVAKMQSRGAVSASIGGEGSESWTPGSSSRLKGLKSEDAYRLLSKHIARSFPIV